jgi:hypothetical protein
VVWLYVAIGVLVLGVVAGLWYWRSFFHDYAYDAALSFADEAFGGVIGLDFGDFIAAILMYRGERNRIGALPALFVAWEASNFFPLGLIPFFGTGLEYVLNVFPAATVLNALFNKEDKAQTARRRVEQLSDICEAFNVTVDDEDAEDAYEAGDWVEASKLYQDVLNDVESMIERSAYDKASEVKREAHRVLRQADKAGSRRSRRVRRTVPRIDDYIERARQELGRSEYEDAAVDVLTSERLLDRVKQN